MESNTRESLKRRDKVLQMGLACLFSMSEAEDMWPFSNKKYDFPVSCRSTEFEGRERKESWKDNLDVFLKIEEQRSSREVLSFHHEHQLWKEMCALDEIESQDKIRKCR
ncbi:unnamed protein product [Sphenostylis stenocarpa]|uniref:Uncharacterized protein n=1 Tax=Sphenostylis stenocarpa TaxID=92480 RepID=A0AA86T1Z0_9FABA|nr:unnamed protein product [Sphenostylis stenocarpa]